MANWEKELKKVCLSIPIKRTNTELYEIFRKYLNLRKKEVVCKDCNINFYAHSIGEIKNRICKNCMEKRKEKNEKEKKLWWEKTREREVIREERQIENFNKGYGNTPATDLRILTDNITEEDIKKLKEMKYSDFLKTKYWKIISKYVKYRQEKCQLCGCKNNLNVHHKDYKERGKEYLNWESSLILLCKDCHTKFHDKMEELK